MVSHNRFTIRELTPGDWKILRELRLKSLQMHPGYYLGEYAKAKNYTQEKWQEILDGEGKVVFGLFDRTTPVGITAAFTDQDDPTGQTGDLAYNYIEPAFRGLGLSNLFYDARIKWALENTRWTKLITGHRIDNTASQHTILRNGFELTGKKMRTWPDHEDKYELTYELKLSNLNYKIA